MHLFRRFTMTCRRSLWALAVVALGTVVFAPAPIVAQTDVEAFGRLHGATPPPSFYATLRAQPNAFQFSPDNGWTRRARSIAAQRRAARSRATGASLMAPHAHIDPNGVLTGELNVPVFLILFSNTDADSLLATVPRTIIESRLYGTQPAPPYSIHTYYRELSNDNLLVNGTVLEWTTVANPDTYYEGAAGCNGLGFCGQVWELVAEIVQIHDASVDFGQFDNDGPDGVPNSVDDDGFVDAVVLIHPEVDGSCNRLNPDAQDNIWAHRWNVTDSTTDNAFNGGPIRVRDYIIQGGQGGDDGCTSNEPQAMGLVAHETGHLFGLPDLYDTDNPTGSGGIGHWGMMGAGFRQLPHRPAHMTAWTRAELGWVTEVMISRDTVIYISPIETSDTAYVLPIAGSNEYFLLANRQPIGSDAQLIEPGLLTWHIDSVLTRQRGLPTNTVNTFLPYGVALEQADGLDSLTLPTTDNRGDAGDPWPGSFARTEFSFKTTPSTDRNDGTQTFIKVDQIQQLAPLGAVRARITFGTAPAVATADVVEHLIGITMPLSADALAYLDIMGNQNGRFDVGDFLAWVESPGAQQ